MKICTLHSGSKGNATLVQSGGTKILIDCGVSYATLKRDLLKFNLRPADITAVVVTHSHSDHVCGMGSFILYNANVPIYVSARGAQAFYERTFTEPIAVEGAFSVNDVQIQVYYCHHDADGCCGYKFKDGENTVAYVTDTGLADKQLIAFLRGAETVVIESNHDQEMLMHGKYPLMLKRRIISANGHLSNQQTAKLLEEVLPSGTRNVVLAHLSENNNTEELAYSSAEEVIEKLGLKDKVRLFIAGQNKMSEVL